MRVNDSKGHKVGLRELIDGLRDNFVILLGADEHMEATIANYDRAVSEMILDLLDTPAPPSRVHKVRRDAGLPRVAKTDPPVARVPRRRGQRRGLPTSMSMSEQERLAGLDDANKQASIDDVAMAAGE